MKKSALKILVRVAKVNSLIFGLATTTLVIGIALGISFIGCEEFGRGLANWSGFIGMLGMLLQEATCLFCCHLSRSGLLKRDGYTDKYYLV